MKFSNKDIFEFLVNPLRRFSQLDIRMLADQNGASVEIDENSEERIAFVSFDGRKENFHVSFSAYVSLFISDLDFEALKLDSDWSYGKHYTFDGHFMFIDDDTKKIISESETYGNIVYEGTLRDKTHKEILTLIKDFVIVLIGTQKMEVISTETYRIGLQYLKHNYIIKITNPTKEKKRVVFENITFLINEDE